jgi:excisionase family DNA binding protein
LADAVGDALVRHIVEVPAGEWQRVILDLEGVHAAEVEPGRVPPRLRAHLKTLVVRALDASLSARTEEGRRLRMAMVGRLARLELGDEHGGGNETAGAATDLPAAVMESASTLLTTAEAAARLGVSRPHVAMLCDAGKLGEVTVTEGGHRRINASAVEAYVAAQARAPQTPRQAAQAANLYARPDADFVAAGRRQVGVGVKKPAGRSKRASGQ